MRNVLIDAVDAIARPVLAIGTDYPPGQLLPTHSHRRAQFLYGATGVMEVGTDDGAWWCCRSAAYGYRRASRTACACWA